MRIGAYVVTAICLGWGLTAPEFLRAQGTLPTPPLPANSGASGPGSPAIVAEPAALPAAPGSTVDPNARRLDRVRRAIERARNPLGSGAVAARSGSAGSAGSADELPNAAPGADTFPGRIDVEGDANRISIYVPESEPLSRVVQAVASHLGAPLKQTGELTAQFSGRLNGLRVQTALNKLLGERASSVLKYARYGGELKVESIIIIVKGAAGGGKTSGVKNARRAGAPDGWSATPANDGTAETRSAKVAEIQAAMNNPDLPGAQLLLRYLLTDPDPKVRQNAAVGVGRFTSDELKPMVADGLLDAVATETEIAVRNLVIRQLGGHQGDEVGDALLKVLLGDDDASARQVAASALARYGGKEAEAALRKAAANDESAEVKAAAARALRQVQRRNARRS